MKLTRELEILADYLDDMGWEYDILQNHGDNKTRYADTIRFIYTNNEIDVRSYEWEDPSNTGLIWWPLVYGSEETFDDADELIDDKLANW